MDTYIGECKICGTETDLIQGYCLECNELDNWLEKRYKARNLRLPLETKELIIALIVERVKD